MKWPDPPRLRLGPCRPWGRGTGARTFRACRQAVRPDPLLGGGPGDRSRRHPHPRPHRLARRLEGHASRRFRAIATTSSRSRASPARPPAAMPGAMSSLRWPKSRPLHPAARPAQAGDRRPFDGRNGRDDGRRPPSEPGRQGDGGRHAAPAGRNPRRRRGRHARPRRQPARPQLYPRRAPAGRIGDQAVRQSRKRRGSGRDRASHPRAGPDRPDAASCRASPRR